MMERDDLEALAVDIKEHGQRLPIMLYEGKILDGRNRYAACEIAEVEPVFDTLPDDTDPVAYVASMNDLRRHLTASQRAMFADKHREHLEEQAKERMLAGKKVNPPETLPEGKKGDSRDQAGKVVGVSGRTMDKAKKVREQGHKKLVNAVELGRIDVTNAAKIADLPKETQETILEDAERNHWSGRQMIQEAQRLTGRKGGTESNGGNDTRGCPHPIRMGLQYARMAIAQLQKIAKRDKERTQALNMVQEWIAENK